MPILSASALIESRCAAICGYHLRTGIDRAQLDVSGGVDSAVLLALLARAIGPEKITAVYSSIHSSDSSRSRAEEIARACNVPLIKLDLSEIFDQLSEHLQSQAVAAGYSRAALESDIQSDPTVLGSLRSCLRAPIGRGLNRMTRGGIRHGTGNECEDRFIRFYQKGGDGEVDTNPIQMLSKGEVYQLAAALDVPQSILEALPSPDLHGNAEAHNDEDELRELTGVAWTYSRVDPQSGQYQALGTIELTSRFLDRPGVSELLFGDAELSAQNWSDLCRLARTHEFHALSGQGTLVEALLRSARKLEKSSRHKFNPAIPSLGRREQLVIAGWLDNRLPDLPIAGL